MVYTLPVLYFKSWAILIVPLTALITDLCEAAHQKGIKFINANEIETCRIRHLILTDYLKTNTPFFLLCTPEKFLLNAELAKFLSFAIKKKPPLIILDECHVIIEWGLSFRPAYVHLFKQSPELHSLQIVACSGSIRKEELSNLSLFLGHPNSAIVAEYSLKPHFMFQTRSINTLTNGRCKQLASMDNHKVLFVNTIRQLFSPNVGIIFIENIGMCNDLFRYMTTLNINVFLYHSKLTEREKDENYSGWAKTVSGVMIATSAFSMGVDNAHCDFVIYLGLPLSIDNFIQGAGRMGRQQQISTCTIIFDENKEYFTQCKRASPQLPANCSIVKELTCNEYMYMFALPHQEYFCWNNLIYIFNAGQQLLPTKRCNLQCPVCIHPKNTFSVNALISDLGQYFQAISHMKYHYKLHSIVTIAKILVGVNSVFTTTQALNKLIVFGLWQDLTVQEAIINLGCLRLTNFLGQKKSVNSEGKLVSFHLFVR